MLCPAPEVAASGVGANVVGAEVGVEVGAEVGAEEDPDPDPDPALRIFSLNFNDIFLASHGISAMDSKN